jgi:TonB-linked SusC/RagA family outer membrane protein
MKIKYFLMLLMMCLFYQHLSAQNNITVTGTVTDNKGETLIGVGVLVKGTKTGTSTNNQGQYVLSVSGNNPILVISYIGFVSQEIPVNNRTRINVSLESDSKSLDVVVVTGYQTQRKKDLTGAVSVVNMKDVENIPTGNIISTLQGRVPGVNVTNNGTPGGVGTGIGIRGITTINNGTPLYVIDGVQTRDNISTLLNPNDVESIQILKDAASASIYGTQAANGVIIITTKRGKKDQLTVNFDAQLTTQSYHTGIKMLNAQQWGDTYWTAYKNDGVKPNHDLYGNGDAPVIPEFIDQKKTIRSGDTNWADQVYKTAVLQSYNLTVAKGSKNGGSAFSLNYFDQDGLVKYTNFTRINGRLNSDYSFLDNRLRIGQNLNLSKWNEKLKPAGIEELTIAQHPIIPVYDIYGGYAGPTQGIGDKPNPVRLLDQIRDNRSEQWRIFGNMYIEAEPIKNLVLRSNYSVNYRNGFASSFEPKWREGDRSVDKNILNTSSDYNKDWIWSNTANYTVVIDKHNINALAGIESKESINESLGAKRENFLIEAIDYRYINAGDGAQTNSGIASRTATNSVFAKLNYAYNDRYLLSGTVRRDASSRFGQNNNAAVFPAVSGGWRISQENFMKDQSLISDLKLRASWGQNGNDLLDNEATYTKYSTNLNMAGYDISGINQGTIPNGIIKDRTGNPNIKWEVTTQTNFGMDLAMLKDRLNLTLDYYIKKTDDMLIDRPYIGIIGEGGSMAYNGASLSNKGFEAILNWRDKVGRDFNYSLTLTATAYKNKVTAVPDDIRFTYGGGNGQDKTIVGQPLGSWLGYRTNGIYRTAEELNDGIEKPGKGLGRIRYVDTNGDHVINDKDMEWLGSDQPKFIGGLNVSLGYKALDFSFFVNGMVRDAYNNSKFYTDFFQLWTGNHSTRLLDAWNPTNNFNSNIPALTALNSNDEGRTSQYFIENGSYLKLKNIQLGYTLPKALADKAKLRNLRIYIQGQDLVTITKYKGADPEGLGYPYPLPRTVTLGLNFGF